MSSADNTMVGANGSITDSAGNVWTITADGQVAVNGVPDPETANVTHLAYAKGLVWQENTQDLWWSKTSPTAAWDPPDGTSAIPVPVSDSLYRTTVIGIATPGSPAPPPSFDDPSGNIWSITPGGQVAVNGVVDPTTANVIELATVNGKIWQENADNLWWSKSAPADDWSYGDGTSDNPLSGGVYFIGNNYYDRAVVNVGKITIQEPTVAPDAIRQIITTGFVSNGSAIGVSAEGAAVKVTGSSQLTNHATLTLISVYRAPLPNYGPVENDGRMSLNASTAHLGSVAGTGSIVASNGSSLDVQADTGNTIQLQSSHLNIGGQGWPGDWRGPAGGLAFIRAPIKMDAASSIILANTTATSEVLDMHSGSVSELLLYNGTSEVADLKISGVPRVYAEQTLQGGAPAVWLSATPDSHPLPITFLQS